MLTGTSAQAPPPQCPQPANESSTKGKMRAVGRKVPGKVCSLTIPHTLLHTVIVGLFGEFAITTSPTWTPDHLGVKDSRATAGRTRASASTVISSRAQKWRLWSAATRECISPFLSMSLSLSLRSPSLSLSLPPFSVPLSLSLSLLVFLLAAPQLGRRRVLQGSGCLSAQSTGRLRIGHIWGKQDGRMGGWVGIPTFPSVPKDGSIDGPVHRVTSNMYSLTQCMTDAKYPVTATTSNVTPPACLTCQSDQLAEQVPQGREGHGDASGARVIITCPQKSLAKEGEAILFNPILSF